MKRPVAYLVALLALVSLLLAACAQAPTPTPTKSPAAPTTKAAEPTKPTGAPTKAAEPTKPASTAAPAAAPAKKVNFPEKGKTITMIVPFPPGGGLDIGARLLQPPLEAELGVPVQIVNKAGAAGQVGVTEAAKAKPDGYTLGMVPFPTMSFFYLDPARQAAFGRKDLVPVAAQLYDPFVVGVKPDSPIKNAQDLVNAARANPEKIKIGTSGIQSPEHLNLVKLEQEAKIKFAFVHFDGGAPNAAAVLGGHTDAFSGGLNPVMAHAKSGALRLILSFDTGADSFIPGVKSMEEQGFKGYFGGQRGWIVPAGTPTEIVDILTAAIKKAMENKEFLEKVKETGQAPRYMDPKQFSAYFDMMEREMKPLMELTSVK